ncbi:hypothetical protein ACFFLM_10515 [Deinococcus oregonensis]|uniref:Uncharacterized protein n=1 Tax=Deinococcus oregonensis TaxID=1805970 RepID=A0ABV6AY18_9DEIO
MSQSSRTVLPPDLSGSQPSSPTAQRPLTGFEILSGRATMFGGVSQKLPTLHAPSPTQFGEAAPVPEALPDRLREVDLKMAHERELVVDALEIASYLEADGLSDESLRGRYNAGGLFQAAELLYAQRGSGRALNRLPAAPLPAFPWYMLLRGPLYLMPGLAGLLITRPLGLGAAAAFTFAAAFGWGWSMTISGLRYSEPFAVPGRALRASLWWAGLIGTVGGALTALILDGPDQLLLDALSGGGVALATAASGILLSLGRTGLSAGALGLPLLAAAVVKASSPAEPDPLQVVGSLQAALALQAAAPATTASLVLPLVGLAILTVSPVLAVLHATREPGTLPTTWAVFKPHLRLASYGWAMALTFVGFSLHFGAWSLLPIIVSAGLLEAGVWHSQERLQHAARSLRTLPDLRWRGRVTVPVVAALYGLLVGLSLVLIRVTGLLPQLGGLSVGTQLGVALLGTAFLLSAWLANQRQVALLLVLWSVAAVLTFTAVVPLPVLSLALVLILFLNALSALNDPRSYR